MMGILWASRKDFKSWAILSTITGDVLGRFTTIPTAAGRIFEYKLNFYASSEMLLSVTGLFKWKTWTIERNFDMPDFPLCCKLNDIYIFFVINFN